MLFDTLITPFEFRIQGATAVALLNLSVFRHRTIVRCHTLECIICSELLSSKLHSLKYDVHHGKNNKKTI